jgi:hypothetical protein
MATYHKHLFAVVVLLALMLLTLPAGRAAAILPGTPLGGGAFGTLDIVDGINVLPGQVTPGDVVMLENPSGPLDRTNWSDIVRFFNFTTSLNGTIGIAYKISDGEAGIPRIDILDENLNAIQPDVLSSNNQFINEVQVGTGTEADITPYTVPGALYNIHSDAALSELPETFPAAPFQLIALAGGGKGWLFYTMVEGTCGFDCARLQSVRAAFVPGNGVVNEAGGGISDILNVVAQPGNPNFSNITLTSFADDNNSTLLDDLEVFPLVRGDESGGGILIEGTDLPEPSTYFLLMSGLLLFGGARALRKKFIFPTP